MNRVETWLIEEMEDIEDAVNKYCGENYLNPISISVTYDPTRVSFVVCVVVEQGED